MAFPHPKSRKDHDRKEDKPNSGGVLGNFFKRTINITEYRNAKDDVNPAKNRSFDALVHDSLLSMPTLLQPGDNSFQATDELLPAVVRAFVGGLLIETEARLLHAHERSAAFRDQRPDDDAVEP